MKYDNVKLLKCDIPYTNKYDIKYKWQGKRYELAEDITYEGITIPKGFTWDGASIPFLCMRLFTHTDLIKAFYASLVHDYLCANKHLMKRKQATKTFIKLWKAEGFGDKWYTSWKPVVVYLSTNIYQWFKGWK